MQKYPNKKKCVVLTPSLAVSSSFHRFSLREGMDFYPRLGQGAFKVLVTEASEVCHLW